MMLKRFFALSSLVLCGLVASACSAETTDAPDEGSAEDDITQFKLISDDDNGKTITITKGKPFHISLASNATTGFKWKVVSTTRSMGYPSPKDGEHIQPAGNRPTGALGRQVFKWSTSSPLLNPGSASHAIKLEYRRSFESDSTPAAKTFTVKIKIKAAGAAPPAGPDPDLECPTMTIINCMPIVPESRAKYCARDYRTWAQANCDVSYLD
jgi:predicted secreted protein